MSKRSYKTDVELIDLFSKLTPGPWTLGKNEKDEWELYSEASNTFVMKNIPKATNYDRRAMSMAAELLQEVLELRLKARRG